MSTRLRWGIIGTGGIARQFARGLLESDTGQLSAVGSRSLESARAFAQEFPATPYASYEALLADSNVQAVYIATPHPAHAEWAIRSLQAGKPVLCEKPFTLNRPEAQSVINVARQQDVFLMEAFMYRTHPQTTRLVELIREKAIGEVRFIQATFSFCAPYDPNGRLLNRELGGGGILDVGCYCVSMARLVAGAAIGEPFQNPLQVKGVGAIGQTGVDEYAIASLRFPGGILAQVATGVQLNLENHVTIVGTGGTLHLPNPWTLGGAEGTYQIQLIRDQRTETIHLQPSQSSYAIEADHIAHQLALGQKQSPFISWADTLGNMQTLDEWRAQIISPIPGSRH